MDELGVLLISHDLATQKCFYKVGSTGVSLSTIFNSKSQDISRGHLRKNTMC